MSINRYYNVGCFLAVFLKKQMTHAQTRHMRGQLSLSPSIFLQLLHVTNFNVEMVAVSIKVWFAINLRSVLMERMKLFVVR